MAAYSDDVVREVGNLAARQMSTARPESEHAHALYLHAVVGTLWLQSPAGQQALRDANTFGLALVKAAQRSFRASAYGSMLACTWSVVRRFHRHGPHTLCEWGPLHVPVIGAAPSKCLSSMMFVLCWVVRCCGRCA
jgi:hypothetical protein